MNALERTAHSLGRRDEVPNQQLAAELARTEDQAGIAEIAANLANKDRNIQSDCLKVLYEVGYLKPALIVDYVDQFIDQLSSRNNRMVWGAMIALATIAPLSAARIWKRIDEVVTATDKGSLITLVWGIRTLAVVAAGSAAASRKLLPTLKRSLRECVPRDVPTHLESMIPAMDAKTCGELIRIAESRMKEMTKSHLARLRRVIRKLEK